MSVVTPTEVRYTSNPPRCSECIHKYYVTSTSLDGTKSKKMFCKVLWIKVKARAVCDLWEGRTNASS